MYSNERYFAFDQNEPEHQARTIESESREISRTILDISQVTIDFASVERVPRYHVHKRENNAEHSFMLGLAAMEIGTKYYPGLDAGLMTQFALVHDLVELETKDVPTFKADELTLKAKEKAEHAALKKLQETLPSHIADMLTWYEEQVDPEARLVRHIDKLLPYSVDINGAGRAVMAEDYGVTTLDQLMESNDQLESRFEKMFPEPSHAILRKAHNVLAHKFALQFEEC